MKLNNQRSVRSVGSVFIKSKIKQYFNNIIKKYY